MNNLLAEEVANGGTVVFPSRMGKLELRKFERGVSIGKDGKLKIGYPINWQETIRLWFEDAEEKEKKTLVRKNVPFTYHIWYDKYNATYSNKSMYQFKLNRFIRYALKDNVEKGIIDPLW